MNILVLGGAGMQGRAVLYDLSRSDAVEEIICADIDPSAIAPVEEFLDEDKLVLKEVDIANHEKLVDLMKNDVDVVVDVTPARFLTPVAEAALEAEVHLVNTMYGHMLPDDLDQRAREKGITVMPEAGLDPGIDLILCGYGVSQLEKVHTLYSLTGGIPEEEAADNPLEYKISWTWEGVLWSYDRPAVLRSDGETVKIPAKEIMAPENIHSLFFPDIGQLECIPNGDAEIFAEHLGIEEELVNTGRFTLRWPGHSEIWKKLVDLDFLSQEAVPGLGGVSPHEFLLHHLEPKLQYGEKERDLVVMRNMIEGVSEGRAKRIVFDLVDRRDLETGLMAMNRTVGYTASIIAQMIAEGEIDKRGMLTAVKDVPYRRFLVELTERGIEITQRVTTIDSFRGTPAG